MHGELWTGYFTERGNGRRTATTRWLWSALQHMRFLRRGRRQGRIAGGVTRSEVKAAKRYQRKLRRELRRRRVADQVDPR